MDGGLKLSAILSTIIVALLAAFLGTSGETLAEHSWGSLGDGLFKAHGLDAIRFALPVAFSRFAIPASSFEGTVPRAVVAAILGAIALWNLNLRAQGHAQSFALLLGCQAGFYIGFLDCWAGLFQRLGTALAGSFLVGLTVDGGHWTLAIHAVFCLTAGMCMHFFALKRHWSESTSISLAAALAGGIVLPPLGSIIVTYLFPVNEIWDAYASVAMFVGEQQLGHASMEMLIITANVQVPLGYLGIAYLRHAQQRQNDLLKVGSNESSLTAHHYVCRVRYWVLAIALPYILQNTVMSSVHSHAFGRFRHWTERSLRLHSFFPNEGERGTSLKAVAKSNYTVEQYADAINGAVEMSFGIVSEKIASLPKLLLVPGVLATKPWLLLAVLPASVAMDVGKAWLAAQLTQRIEAVHKELMELANRRRRMELHDMRNEELIQRGQAGQFAERRWRDLGNQIEDAGMRLGAIQRLRGVIDTVYSNQILGPGIECTLAFLMEVDYMTSADIYLYTTVLHQAIDTLMTRHREQATLANMNTKVGLVKDLASHLQTVRTRRRPRCLVDSTVQSARLSSLEYARGHTHVRIPELSLPMGRVIAVTGTNGVGKSTALALMACCGRSSAYLPTGAELLSEASIMLPSDDIVEIAQQFYCPLYSTPMAWLLWQSESTPELQARAVQLLGDFGLIRGEQAGENSHEKSSRGFTSDELHTEKEDWYSELSGGEKCKVEFIRKVFLRPECPKVLLVDEAFAPLDPRSRQMMKARLKEFCEESLVLVVYHGEESLSGDSFFDDNLHFDNGTASLIGLR
eukprot:TRINITY_DN62428_c0_g1_i1.p1 TRINITY_DN62428_c0_g1~~TRINITY_DN62428_c0_g1_i1.p1  ORF type:complete len:800 (-),score=141.16 TRINITY_DN62428_c0_g1_i1:24-2423(-)